MTEQAGSPREAEEWTVGVAGRLALALEALDLPVDHDDLRTLFRPLAGGDEVWSFEVAARACGATIVELGASAPASGSRVMITADGRQLSVERTVPCVGGDPKRPRTGLARRYEGSAPTVWLAALAGTILLVPGVVVPALGRVFVDGYLTTGNGEWRSVVLLGLALCALVQVALTWVQYSALAVLAHRLNVRTSAAFTWHLLRLPAVHRRRFTAGDLTHRASLTQRIGLTGGVMLLGGALNVVSIVFYLAVMAAFDAPLAAIATVVVLVDLTAIRVVLRRRAAAHTAVVEARAALASTTAASIESIESIKAAADEPLHYAAWSVDHSRLMRATSRLGGISQTLATLPPLVHLTGVASVIAVGALQVMNGATTVGTLVAVQGLLLAVLVPVGQIAYLGNLVQDIGGSVRQTDEVLAIPEDVELASDSVERPASSPVAPTLLTGRLELHDVRFGYDPQEAPLLDGLDLVVEPGTWVAIVGASGSGKSTVARLATGLLQPWSGSVELDGVPRALVPRNVRTAGVAYVEQDITVVGDTVVDDLTLWDPSVPEADIVSALTDAALHGEVVTRPGGLQAVLHEGGSNLSGGQRQRLAIARALVRHPRLLVLDEATSALDPVTEEVVYTNLRRRCLTCLVIAHRLSTVRDADEIVVLEHGSVVQRGTHDQLAAVEGRYRTLVLGGHRDG